MPPQFDDAAYQEGRKLFRKRATLRSLLEPLVSEPPPLNSDKATDGDYEARDKARRAKENADFSRVIGFADAVLEHIRR